MCYESKTGTDQDEMVQRGLGMVSVVLQCLLLQLVAGSHIVVLLLDDVGYNDMLESTDISTPTLNRLATEGVQLSQHYVLPVCTPRYPIRYGLQKDTLGPRSSGGLALDEVTLAQELKGHGFHTAAVGKWHLGYSAWEYTPTYRGFDHFYGFMSAGGEDYLTKNATAGSASFRDLWDDRSRVTNATQLDTHNTLLFAEQVNASLERYVAVVSSEERENSPLFLYYAMQNTHEPLQGLSEYVTRCEASGNFSNSDRLQYCALTLMADDAVGMLVDKLAEVGLLDSTLLVVLSDNGGTPRYGGSNYPLRGMKGTLYEGGVRARSFVWGSSQVLPKRGYMYNGLFHVSDWMPSLLAYAGKSASQCQTLDGVSHWAALQTNGTSPRTHMLVNSEDSATGAMRVGNYKLGQCTGPRGKIIAVPADETVPGTACGSVANALYDVVSDPSENTNLYGDPSFAAVQAELLKSLQALQAEAVAPSPVSDPESVVSARENDGWTPWQTISNPPSCTPSGAPTLTGCGTILGAAVALATWLV